VRLQGGVATPLFVTQQTAASVAFVREQRQDTIIKLPEDPNTENAPTPLSTTTFIPQWISASTTRLQVRTAQAASPLPRTASDIRSRWLAGWQLELLLQVVEPNPVALGNEAILDGDLTGLEPGMLVVLATHDGGSAQLVELTSVTVTSATAISAATTTIAFRGRGPAPASGFQKSDLVVLANVIRISHGKTVREVLGDSDGVTPFLRFTLKKSPVTHLPEALGAVPALEVRVDNVLWTRVVDFSQSGPEDRHYLVQRDEAQALSVLFGDGQTGAVPPAGQRHVRAVYRVGTGRIGNVEAGRTSRLQKAHPLVLSALNPLPISGGTEPAAVDQVRTEATRFIRTFDRAVSATDYADLALLFPGIARAKATSDPATGVALVVADADGNALGDSGPFRSFLDTRRDRGVPLRLVAPEPVDVVLAVNVEFDGAFFDFEVAKSVRDAIASSSESAPGLFAFRGRELGQPAFLSEVYRALHAVPGVVFSQITVFDLAPPKQLAPSPKLFRARLPFARRQLAVQDAIQIAAQQWLRVTLDNLSIKPRLHEDD
jgi:predicted phage baseplate assembly protein